ncbi:MAG: MFS transporter [Pseudomonadota bacterium]
MPLLFGVVLLDLIGFGIVIPILPFLSPQLGADKLDIAYIIVGYAVFSALFGPLWGRLSDQIGRKPVIMMCLAGAAISYVMLGLANELWMVYAARVFGGIMAGNFGVASAMMADITKPEDRARGMGLIGAAFGLGLVIGPMLGGVLAGPDGSFLLPCLVAGAMSVSAIFAAAVLLPESLTEEKREAYRAQRQQRSESMYAMLKRTRNRLFVSQYVLHSTGVGAATYLMPLWFADLLNWTAREVGILFGVQGAIMAIVQGGLMGLLVRSVGEWRLLRWCIVFYLAGLLLAVVASEPWMMIASVYIAMTGATLCMPMLNTLITHRTPAPQRGQTMGVTGAAASVGRVIGPLMAGWILYTLGYTAVWIALAALVFIYLLWAVAESRRSAAQANLTRGESHVH